MNVFFPPIQTYKCSNRKSLILNVHSLNQELNSYIVFQTRLQSLLAPNRPALLRWCSGEIQH